MLSLVHVTETVPVAIRKADVAFMGIYVSLGLIPPS